MVTRLPPNPPALLEVRSTEPTRALTLQLLEWIAERPRTYEETLDTWRTSCPRMSIWEDACIAGLIDAEPGSRMVHLSARGKLLLSGR